MVPLCRPEPACPLGQHPDAALRLAKGHLARREKVRIPAHVKGCAPSIEEPACNLKGVAGKIADILKYLKQMEQRQRRTELLKEIRRGQTMHPIGP
jgi:hypothetical protein